MARHAVHRAPSTVGASAVEVIDDDHDVEVVDDDHRALILEGLEQSRRGEIASDEEVRVVLARFKR